MGHSSTKRNVVLVLGALESLLLDQGADVKPGEALQAASGVYETA